MGAIWLRIRCSSCWRYLRRRKVSNALRRFVLCDLMLQVLVLSFLDIMMANHDVYYLDNQQMGIYGCLLHGILLLRLIAHLTALLLLSMIYFPFYATIKSDKDSC